MTLTRSQAQAEIGRLIDRYRNLSDTDRKTTTEASVVHQFINPLLRALGWPVEDTKLFKYELSTQAGRPDMTLFPPQGGTLFVEAKRFGLIQELAEARKTIAGIVTPGQLALPGMASDRTREEQQAINYAFENGGTWAILTNFEKLRLFNARRDWLVLSFEQPKAYLDQFDLLWQLSYDSIISGGLDMLSNQRHREDVDIDYLNFINTWRERLAQDLIAQPEANPWAFDEAGQIKLTALRNVVQRVLDRLVVVRFAEDHLIAPVGTLYSLYEIRRRNPYTFSLAQFFAQLYRRFDEDHNSALFAPSLADVAVFSDEVLGGLVEKLYEARYRAMSADIMGNTYEQYLGKTLVQRDGTVKTADNLETRKKQGSYYTPQVIVRYIVDNALGRYLYGTTNGRPDGEPLEGESRKTAADIRQLQVLDAACGSGSFLIYAYQVLADFYRAEIARLEAAYHTKLNEAVQRGVQGMDLEFEIAPLRAEISHLQKFPRLILENHLYGVDLDSQAAEIATVNLIMRAMADQRGRERYLPLILNQNIKVGNALIGAGPADPRLADHSDTLAELRRLRRELPGLAHGPRRDTTMQRMTGLAEQINADLDSPLADHLADPAAHRPFNWAVEFPEVFLDEQGRPAAQAGFEIIIGNPPWEIVKPEIREYYAQFDPNIESKLTRRQVERRIDELSADPQIVAGWEAQKAKIEESAAFYKTSPAFTRQGRGDTATHKLFLERGYYLLAHGGRLGFVIPTGIYRDLGTMQLREMLLNEGKIDYLFNFSNERFFFPGVDHRFQFSLLGTQKGEESDGFLAAFRFDPRVAISPNDLPQFLADRSNLIYVQRDSVVRFSPDSLSVMEFQSQNDADVTAKIYDAGPLIGEELKGIWSMRLNREFDMTNDRSRFNRNHDGLPLYEGKMIHQFDSYHAQPQYWVSETNAEQHFKQKKSETDPLDYDFPRLGFREIARPTDTRTLIATILPPGTCCNHKISVASPRLSTYAFNEMLFSLAALNSLTLDFVVRFKISSGVSMFHFYQLPLPRLTANNPYFDSIVPRAARLICTTSAFAALWQEVMGEPWDETKGATDPTERQTLRDELDALVAHLYNLTATDFAHILTTFPLVFPPTAEGQAKKETLLAIYERFASLVEGWERA